MFERQPKRTDTFVANQWRGCVESIESDILKRFLVAFYLSCAKHPGRNQLDKQVDSKKSFAIAWKEFPFELFDILVPSAL